MPGSGKQSLEVQEQIKELLEAGFDPTTIHRRLKVGRSSIYRMKRCLQQHGTNYMPPEMNKKNGRPKVLTPEQELDVQEWLRDPKNRTRYLDDLVWLIHDRFGIVCSTTTMSKMKRKWIRVIEFEETGQPIDELTRTQLEETHPDLPALHQSAAAEAAEAAAAASLQQSPTGLQSSSSNLQQSPNASSTFQQSTNFPQSSTPNTYQQSTPYHQQSPGLGQATSGALQQSTSFQQSPNLQQQTTFQHQQPLPDATTMSLSGPMQPTLQSTTTGMHNGLHHQNADGMGMQMPLSYTHSVDQQLDSQLQQQLNDDLEAAEGWK